MKRDEKTLERIYERDKTGAFIISISVDHYVDVFNELDSAPWRRRDIDHDLRLFLEDCSADIPFKYEIILQFNVAQEKQDTAREERLKMGLKTYFTFVRSSLQRKIRNDYERCILYILAAFFLLFGAYALRAASSNIVLVTLIDGVGIAGWVFLWEAISTFAFKGRDARDRYKEYERFSTAEIHFSYSEIY